MKFPTGRLLLAALEDIYFQKISSISHVFASSFIYGMSPRTLNLREIESHENWPKYSALYLVENPSVFSFLVDETLHYLDMSGYSFEQLSDDCPPLICTSGQARSATKYFIRRSLNANPECEIFYSGDFDLPGVQMLKGMEELIQGKVNVFRMDSDTYRRYIDPDSLPLSKKDKGILSTLNGDLAKTMVEAGLKVYQESTVGELKEDWIEVVSKTLTNAT
ncbi:DUF2399 domain-containing protein [Paenibacillus alvei]|nr:DUF2399 domain-containing protein [Paenibacillus alvei]